MIAMNKFMEKMREEMKAWKEFKDQLEAIIGPIVIEELCSSPDCKVCRRLEQYFIWSAENVISSVQQHG